MIDEQLRYRFLIRILDYTDAAKWDAQIARARDLGQESLVETGGRCDPDANLCAVQREQQAAGLVMATLYRNIHGWCIRDTMNDGGGRLSPNFLTPLEALVWAKEWHAENPDKRRVIYFASSDRPNADDPIVIRAIVKVLRPDSMYEPKQISCGCCTEGCVCFNHQDVPSGRPSQKCRIHKEAA